MSNRSSHTVMGNSSSCSSSSSANTPSSCSQQHRVSSSSSSASTSSSNASPNASTCRRTRRHCHDSSSRSIGCSLQEMFSICPEQLDPLEERTARRTTSSSLDTTMFVPGMGHVPSSSTTRPSMASNRRRHINTRSRRTGSSFSSIPRETQAASLFFWVYSHERACGKWWHPTTDKEAPCRGQCTLFTNAKTLVAVNRLCWLVKIYKNSPPNQAAA